MNRACFIVSIAGIFGAFAVGAPGARSQQTPIVPRMSASHANEAGHFSLIDPTLPPTPTGTPVVGRFIAGTELGNLLVEGYPYPNQAQPQFLYGIASNGSGIRRVSTSGAPMDTTSFPGLITNITGACRVKSAVPSPQWQPSGYDLVDHYVIVGDTTYGGYSTGMMLIDPGTMTPFEIGLGNLFVMSGSRFQDVCFGVYPGPDGSYGTATDNEYRYVAIYQTNGSTQSGLISLALNRHETMNGDDPPPEFNPVPPVRGPSYTNAYPQIQANSKLSTEVITSEANGQLYCKSWYARPGLAGFGLATDRTYVIAGWVQLLVPGPPNYYGPILQGYSLGTISPIVSVTAPTGPPGGVAAPNNNFGQLYDTDRIFQSMSLVGDWLICSIGDAVGVPGTGAYVQAVYVPEFLDGAGDGDNGVRAPFQPAGRAGRAGYLPTVNGAPSITYVGSGSNVLYGTTLSALQNHPVGAGLLNSMTPIDMHTQEEQLLGLNMRQGPQPFVGYWRLDDPADTFPGSVGGSGSGGGGGCSKSVGSGGGSTGGLLALLGFAFLLTLLMREVRGPCPLRS